jgi:hypothetical protein
MMMMMMIKALEVALDLSSDRLLMMMMIKALEVALDLSSDRLLMMMMMMMIKALEVALDLSSDRLLMMMMMMIKAPGTVEQSSQPLTEWLSGVQLNLITSTDIALLLQYDSSTCIRTLLLLLTPHVQIFKSKLKQDRQWMCV